MKRTKEYEKFKEIQRSENEQMEYRQQNVFHLNTKVMSLESELKIANRKLKTEARKMEKLQSELDSCQEEATKANNLIEELNRRQKLETNGLEVSRKKMEAGSQLHEAFRIISRLGQLQDIFKIVGIALLYLTGAISKDLNQTDSKTISANSPPLGRPPGKLWKRLGELIQKNSNYKTRLTLPLLQMMIQKNAKESTAGECKKKTEGPVAAMRSVSWCDGQLRYASSDPTHI